jgi:dienelactone hydrolase
MRDTMADHQSCRSWVPWPAHGNMTHDQTGGVVVATALLTLIVLTACAPREPLTTLAEGQTGTIAFQTMTLTAAQFLTGAKDGQPALISGVLRLPQTTAARLPAVVLVHGSSGVGYSHQQWAARLNDIGVATFLMDSFTGRGITQTVENQGQLSSLAMIYDAYRALALLASHPRIDPVRVVVMGFSKGGVVSLYAALTRFQRMHGPAGVEFAAYVPFYPACNYTFIDGDQLSNRPIRIFHGADDDWTPVAPCRTLVEQGQQAGKDIHITVYPGAYHGFDVSTQRPAFWVARAQNTSRCFVIERADGRLINRDTGHPFSFQDACITYGTTVGYHPGATSHAIKAVQAFFTETLQ